MTDAHGEITVAQVAQQAEDLERLAAFVLAAGRLVVLTGAGCSTESGIPDYRSPGGLWTNHKPIYYADFVRSATARQRYWARSMAGWSSFHRAAPNPAHLALARLEALGRVQYLITQNVDRLHQAAGSRNVLELHGNNDGVVCLGCGHEMTRQAMQRALRFILPRSDQMTVLLIEFDATRDRDMHFALRALHVDGVLGDLHLHAGGKRYRFSSDSRHGSTKPRTRVRRPRLPCGRSGRS